MLLAAGFSDEAQKQLAEAVQSAAGREPLTYLVLLFSVVVLVLIGVGLRHVLKFIANRDERDEERTKRHEANEKERMATIQAIGSACHLNQREVTMQTSSMFDKFGDRLDENTAALRTLIEKQA
jgi:putative exporter of polyketide antibiotics